eukprot:6138103-Prymnesium_polylepis.1
MSEVFRPFAGFPSVARWALARVSHRYVEYLGMLVGNHCLRTWMECGMQPFSPDPDEPGADPAEKAAVMLVLSACSWATTC